MNPDNASDSPLVWKKLYAGPPTSITDGHMCVEAPPRVVPRRLSEQDKTSSSFLLGTRRCANRKDLRAERNRLKKHKKRGR